MSETHETQYQQAEDVYENDQEGREGWRQARNSRSRTRSMSRSRSRSSTCSREGEDVSFNLYYAKLDRQYNILFYLTKL